MSNLDACRILDAVQKGDTNALQTIFVRKQPANIVNFRHSHMQTPLMLAAKRTCVT